MQRRPTPKTRATAALQLTPELVARTIKVVEDEGPEPHWTPISSQQLDALVKRVEEEAADEDLWIFAYGSLMWNPGFEPSAIEPAVVHGWHRAFALRIERLRATTEFPGLMLALRPGGSCSGIVLKLSRHARRQDIRRLLAREIRYAEVCEMTRWVSVRTPSGTRRALTFWASPKTSPLTEKIGLDETARLIAQACGPAGSCAEYLYRAVSHLADRGVQDRNLWRLQTLVAGKIQDLHGLTNHVKRV